MSILQINDLPFYETVTDAEVQGGLFYYRNLTNLRDLLLQRLSYSPTLKQYFSEEREGFVVEDSREDGDGYTYRLLSASEDGKSQITVELGRRGNSNFTFGYITSST